jgi:peptidoglycan/LPS O-acetylase OafA/YrhL
VTAEKTAHDQRQDFASLTGLRIVAALWVVLFHVAAPLAGTYAGPLAPVWPVLRMGWVGVDLFFVLSGFVITHSYLSRMGDRPRPGLMGRFLWARFARVWPVWAVVTAVFAVTLLVTGSASRADSYSAEFSVGSTIEQLLMVQLWGSDTIARTSYVVPGWSLSAEWLAYVCFPVLALLLFRLRRLPWWLLATLSVLAMAPFAASSLLHGDNHDLWEIRIAGGFLAGALMNMAVRRLTVTPTVQRWAGGVAAVAVLELVLIGLWSSSWTGLSKSGVAVLLFPVLVGALALSNGALARALGTPVMQLGGRISYSLYLVHTCLFFVLDTLAARQPALAAGSPNYMALLPQVVLLTLPAAYLLWRFVEEPCRSWLMAHQPRLPGARSRQAAAGAVPAPQVSAAQPATAQLATARIVTPRIVTPRIAVPVPALSPELAEHRSA